MPPKSQIIWKYGRPNVQINFGLKNHIFCTFQIIWAAQIILECTNYFGMYKLFWNIQIILEYNLNAKIVLARIKFLKLILIG
jgi:hypothetical protein